MLSVALATLMSSQALLAESRLYKAIKDDNIEEVKDLIHQKKQSFLGSIRTHNYINRRLYNTTPLNHALENGSVKVAKLLIKSGAKIHNKNHNGINPLLIFLRQGRNDPELLHLLSQGDIKHPPKNPEFIDISTLIGMGYNHITFKNAGISAELLYNAWKATLKDLSRAGFQLPELVELPDNPNEICAAGFTFAELKSADINDMTIKAAGYPATDFLTWSLKQQEINPDYLTKLGFQLQDFNNANPADLVKAGFNLQEVITHSKFKKVKSAFPLEIIINSGLSADFLLNSGLNAKSLIKAGWTAKQFKNDGFDAKKLHQDLQVSLSKLKAIGFSATELAPIIQHPKELKRIGFSFAELKSLGFDDNFLKQADFSAKECFAWALTQPNLPANYLFKLGFKLSNFAQASLANLIKAGFTLETVISANHFSLKQLRSIYSLRELKNAGIKSEILLKNNINVATIVDNGWQAADFKREGISAATLYTKQRAYLRDLRRAGFSVIELAKVVGNPEQLRQAGFSFDDLNAAGFDHAFLKIGGYPAKNFFNWALAQEKLPPQYLQNLNFSPNDFESANLKNLVKVGFNLEDIINARGFDLEILQKEFSKPEIIFCLLNSGRGISPLLKAGWKSHNFEAEGFTAENLYKKWKVPLRDLWQAQYSAYKLAKICDTPKRLRETGFTFQELEKTIYDHKLLRQAGYPPTEFLNWALEQETLPNNYFSNLNLTLADFTLERVFNLVKVGFSLKEIIASNYFSFKSIKENFSIEKLAQAGMSTATFLNNDIPVISLINADWKASKFLDSGFNAAKLYKEYHAKLAHLKFAGFPSKELVKIADNSKELREAEFSFDDLDQASVDHNFIKAGGYPASDFLDWALQNQANSTYLTNLGFSPADFDYTRLKDLIKLGFTLKDIIDSMPFNIKALQKEFSTSDIILCLLKSGKGIKPLLKADWKSNNFEAEGFTANSLYKDWKIPLRDLWQAQYSAYKLAKCDNPKCLRRAGFTFQELEKTIYDHKLLRQAGYPPADFLNWALNQETIPNNYFSDLSFILADFKSAKVPDLIKVGFKLTEIVKSNYFEFSDLRAKFSIEDLTQAGMPASRFLKNNTSVADLIHAGWTAADFLASDYSAAKLYKKYAAKLGDLKRAGFPVINLVKIVRSPEQLREAGFSFDELDKAGLDHNFIKIGGYPASDFLAWANRQTQIPPYKYLIDLGFTLADFKFTDLKNLVKAGLDPKDIIKAKRFKLKKLAEVFTRQDFLKANVSTRMLLEQKVNPKILYKQGHPAKILINAGISPAKLLENNVIDQEIIKIIQEKIANIPEEKYHNRMKVDELHLQRTIKMFSTTESKDKDTVITSLINHQNLVKWHDIYISVSDIDGSENRLRNLKKFITHKFGGPNAADHQRLHARILSEAVNYLDQAPTDKQAIILGILSQYLPCDSGKVGRLFYLENLISKVKNQTNDNLYKYILWSLKKFRHAIIEKIASSGGDESQHSLNYLMHNYSEPFGLAKKFSERNFLYLDYVPSAIKDNAYDNIWQAYSSKAVIDYVVKAINSPSSNVNIPFEKYYNWIQKALPENFSTCFNEDCLANYQGVVLTLIYFGVLKLPYL